MVEPVGHDECSAVAGYVACAYLFIAPRGEFGLDVLQNRVGALAYLFTCVLIIGFGEALRVARKRVEQWLVRLEAVRGLGQVDEGSDARADERLEPSLSTVGPWVAGVLAR